MMSNILGSLGISKTQDQIERDASQALQAQLQHIAMHHGNQSLAAANGQAAAQSGWAATNMATSDPVEDLITQPVSGGVALPQAPHDEAELKARTSRSPSSARWAAACMSRSSTRTGS